MKLSKLVFLSIKNANYLDNYDFDYEAFKKEIFKNDPDYATNLNNAFLPMNEAIARLSDLERVCYRVETITQTDNIVDLTTAKNKVKQVMAIAQIKNGKIRKLYHRNFGINKILINSYIDSSLPLYIEYKEDIPVFDKSFYHYEYDIDGNLVQASSYDVELNDYGITDSMCNYIMEYIMGKLTESTSAEIANLHLSRAEQYFVGISSVDMSLSQTEIEKVNTIGD